MAEINYLAVLVSSVIAMIIGSLWYRVLFGKAWIKLMNINEKQIKESKNKGMAKSYFIMFISLLVMNYVLAHFIQYTQSNKFSLGMETGFWIWLGFLATTMLGIVLWENKPFKLYLINASNYLVMLLISGGILASWQ
jgi:hypothetical protein